MLSYSHRKERGRRDKKTGSHAKANSRTEDKIMKLFEMIEMALEIYYESFGYTE